jgi:hypothetical protein
VSAGLTLGFGLGEALGVVAMLAGADDTVTVGAAERAGPAAVVFPGELHAVTSTATAGKHAQTAKRRADDTPAVRIDPPALYFPNSGSATRFTL